MSDRIRKMTYAYVMIPNRAGEGAKLLGALEQSGVNLVAFSAFPAEGRDAQVDLVAEHPTALRSVARKHGWTLSGMKKGFLVQGADRLGAVHRHVRKLADVGISVTAADAVSAGKGRYGMILWVRPKDYTRAARALKAT